MSWVRASVAPQHSAPPHGSALPQVCSTSEGSMTPVRLPLPARTLPGLPGVVPIDQGYQIVDRPELVAHLGGQGRRHLERLVHLNEVVPDRVERDPGSTNSTSNVAARSR